MKKIVLLFAGICMAFVPGLFAEDWSVEVAYVDACACNVICPCLFGSDPTNRECLGQGFIRVTKGHYGDVDLTGVMAHHAYKMGGWERYTVTDKASPEQVAAFRKVIEANFVLPGGEIVSYTQGKVRYKNKDGKVTLSVADSDLEIEVVPGADGKPLRIANHPRFQNYRQHVSIKNTHKSEHGEFDISGKNAFLAKIVASSGS